MHALSVIYVLRAIEGVAEFKLVQHAVDDLEVLVVPGTRWGESSRAQISQGLEARMGRGTRVIVRTVDQIPVEPSGKSRQVISHVPLRSGLAPATAAAGTSEAAV
jgi:phenylacetate-CoA ligase